MIAKTCKDKVHEELNSRMQEITELYEGYNEEGHLEELEQYPLCIDVVEPGTFDNRERYIRYQISWGGPSDEFRIYENGEVEYWYMDWMDGAKLPVVGPFKEIMQDLVQHIWEGYKWPMPDYF